MACHALLPMREGSLHDKPKGLLFRMLDILRDLLLLSRVHSEQVFIVMCLSQITYRFFTLIRFETKLPIRSKEKANLK